MMMIRRTRVSPEPYCARRRCHFVTNSNMAAAKETFTTKVIVVGDAATGKTSLIKRYVHNIPPSKEHHTTIGVEFSLKTLKVDDEIVNVQVWDLAGQDRFQGLARIYYRDAFGAFVVFDVMNPNSFESARRWKMDIDSKVFLRDGSKIPVILLGNKYDLIESGAQPAISEAEIEQFATENGFAKWFYTSAESGHNVKTACNHLVAAMVQNHRKLKAAGVAVKKDDASVVSLSGDNAAPVSSSASYSQPAPAAGGGCC